MPITNKNSNPGTACKSQGVGSLTDTIIILLSLSTVARASLQEGFLSLATLVTVQWRVEARDEVDSGDDCGTFMGEVEVGTRTDWGKNRRRSHQERNITKNFGDGVMVRLCEGQHFF